MAKIISKKMADIIHNRTGLSVEKIRNTPIEEVHEHIQRKIGHKLTYAKGERDLAGRGNVRIEGGKIAYPEDLRK